MKQNLKYLTSIAALSLILILVGCGTASENENEQEHTNSDKQTEADTSASDQENPIVTITMENGGKILVELYPDIAPNTVHNFVSLIEQGYYDGLIFHRVIPGFMIQGGDPEGNGTGGPGYSIKGEFSSNGFENNLKHDRGVISMARSNHPDSAGSQFFIMVENSPHLDGDYAAFGKVLEGMDVVDEIVTSDRDGNNKRMEKVEVDTKGIDYPEPEIQE
ncbi:peptidylprolyl isomerase [Ornithinibacillus sp. L9]|uniref:Peptidyl-prolyl cis-trans isomerase n=1 Tax=Ornithinibacillus caprae TaxID=2678566 RepID=A0A6N8FD85_9BACI|nr:peptidylprolyl isomerase [Ornithinibacillus caprae]MUK87470.1 peptidylprolyl isomerase [Ornithinibacillus caprae]